MNDDKKWRAARIEDLEKRGRFTALREHLGIHSFGINAITLGDDGTLINEHDESGSGQEEVYVVLSGTASFEIDGETVEAPAGTFIAVPSESRRKATGEATVLALGGTPGQAYQPLDWGDAWPIHDESMKAYSEKRYSEALLTCVAASSASRTTPDSTTTTRASRRSPGRSTTRPSHVCGGRVKPSRPSANRLGPTKTWPPYATTPASVKRSANPRD